MYPLEWRKRRLCSTGSLKPKVAPKASRFFSGLTEVSRICFYLFGFWISDSDLFGLFSLLVFGKYFVVTGLFWKISCTWFFCSVRFYYIGCAFIILDACSFLPWYFILTIIVKLSNFKFVFFKHASKFRCVILFPRYDKWYF